MTTNARGCMGGWCTSRDRCIRYVEAVRRDTDVQRKCPPGRDEPDLIDDIPVRRIHRPAGTWERVNSGAMLKRPNPLEVFA